MYKERLDGRDWNELRPITAKAGVIKNAQGSAYFKIGNTTAYAAVYGPRSLHPKFLQNPKTGILRCYYNMMPFSGMGDRVRPGGGRRSKEISMVMKHALEPVLDLSDFPNTAVDVFVELSSTDAGSRCAAICAASIALADAGLVMKDLVSAIAVGKADDKILVDLDYKEEHLDEFNPDSKDAPIADIPVAIMHNTGEISLLQMDGDISQEDLIKSLEMAREAVAEIYAVQQQALKDKYKGD